MLSSEELADLQTDMAALLDLTADIQRAQLAPDGFGQMTETWASILPNGPIAAGMVTPQGGYLQQLAQQLVNQASWVVSFPSGASAPDVQVRDRVLIQGLTLTVQHLLNPNSTSAYTQVLASTLR
jgi:hypothetical protein